MRFGSNLSFLFSAFQFYPILLMGKQFYFKLEQQSWRRLCFGCETWGESTHELMQILFEIPDRDSFWNLNLTTFNLGSCTTCDSRSRSALQTVPDAATGRLNTNGAFLLAEPHCGNLHFHDQFNQTDPLRGPRPRWINSSLWAKSSKMGMVTPAERSQSILILPKEAFCFNYWRFIVADMF